jgi:hypothetical protein
MAAAVGAHPPVRHFRLAIGASLAAVVALLTVGIWQFLPSTPTVPTIAVVPAIASDGESRALAQSIALDLSRYPAGSAGPLRVVDPASSDNRGDYRVVVRTGRTPTEMNGELTLEQSGKSQILWSAPVGVPGGAVVDLRQQAVSKLSDVLGCLSETRQGRTRISDQGLGLYLKGCGALSDVDTDAPSEEVLSVWRQLTSTEPRFAPGWAYLAFLELDAWANVPVDRRSTVIREAREQLRRAKSIDGSFPAIFAAEANLPENWLNPVKGMAIVERGLQLHPDSALLHGMRSDLLRLVGRTGDSISEAMKAMQLKPLSPAERNRYISLVAYAGQTSKAFDELRKAEEIWPGSLVLREARYRMDLRYGDPKNAMRMLLERGIGGKTPDERPLPIDAAWQAFINARINPTSANVEKGLSGFRERYRRNPADAWPYLQALGTFGRVDEAYRVLQLDETLQATHAQTDNYFRIHMRPIYSDPRFMRVAYRLGLLTYWEQTGMWPDFCDDAHLPYDCKAESAKFPLEPPPRIYGRL